MKVAVHFIARQEMAQGVWWVDERGELKSAYVPESPVEPRGRYFMSQKREDVPYLAYWEQLAGRTPIVDDWEVVEIGGRNPKEYLRWLRELARTER